MSRPTTKQIAELKQAAKQLLLNCERTTFLAPSLDRVRAAVEAFEKPTPDVTSTPSKSYTSFPRGTAIAAWALTFALSGTGPWPAGCAAKGLRRRSAPGSAGHDPRLQSLSDPP